MFPSPIGELHFSILVQKTLFVLLHRFRPLSGSYISQFFDTGFIAIITPPFPSPIGELHFSITKRELINITDKQFPSPIGELHFSIIFLIFFTIFLLTVSVPYRGATFLNAFNNNLNSNGVDVSVPYRGATFLNTIPATPCPVWDE